MTTVQALIPSASLRRVEEDWLKAIRILLSLPHSPTDIPCINKTFSAMVWASQKDMQKAKGRLTRIFIPVSLFPEYESESTCVA